MSPNLSLQNETARPCMCGYICAKFGACGFKSLGQDVGQRLGGENNFGKSTITIVLHLWCNTNKVLKLHKSDLRLT